MTHTIPLPPRLDVEAASTLWNSILMSKGDLHLDAAELHHLGAAGLQTLLMAQRHRQGLGQSFALVNAGPDIIVRLGILGATRHFADQTTDLSGGRA